MFDEEDDELSNGSLNSDIQQFEEYLNGSDLGYFDSDRLEGILDHYLLNGEFYKANIAAEIGLEKFAYLELFKIRKAQCLSGLGNLKEALVVMDGLDETGNNFIEIILTKASIYSQLKDSNKAIIYLQKALDQCEPEDKDELYLDLSLEFQNLGKITEAINVLKMAIKLNPQNESALYEIAYLYDLDNQFESSITYYKEFIDENPYSFTAWYNLGNAYSKLEDYENAVKSYDYAILINKSFSPAHFNMGNACLSTEKFHKAIEHFEECLAIDGDDTMALCYLGEAHEQLNELDLAKNYYNRALQLTPTLSEAWLGLGIVEDLLGNTTEGITFIRKALYYDPNNAGMYHVLAGALEKIGQSDEAKINYCKSLELNPDDEDCLSDYIELLMEDSPLDALKTLQEFRLDNSDNPIAKVLEVNLRWMLGEKEVAIRLFADCLQENSLKAKTIFEINPNLLDDQDFIKLSAE